MRPGEFRDGKPEGAAKVVFPDGRVVELRYANNSNPSVRLVTSQGNISKHHVSQAPCSHDTHASFGLCGVRKGNVYEGTRDMTKEKPSLEIMKQHLQQLQDKPDQVLNKLLRTNTSNTINDSRARNRKARRLAGRSAPIGT